MCYDSFQVIDQPRPCLFVINLAGSHANFRGVCFSVAYTTPNGKSCRSFPKNRSIYHNSRCTYPVKRPQSLSDAKNVKNDVFPRVNRKNASGTFSARCMTMHKTEWRSVWACLMSVSRIFGRFPPENRLYAQRFLIPRPVEPLHANKGR